MDQLGEKEREGIKKLSDVRLTSHLAKAGVDPEELEGMDRPVMLDRWARIRASGDPNAPTSGGSRSRPFSMT